MEITYIEEFLVLARICNYNRAADELFISQSSLFNHIKALEAELGVSLFDRKGKNIVLSDYGQIFVPYARAIRTAAKEYIQAIRSSRDDRSKKILIGTQYRITDLIKEFRSRHPEYKLRIFDNYNAIKALDEGHCELAFIRDVPPSVASLYNTIPYVVDSIVAAVSSDHPLAGRKKLRLYELRDEEFVIVDQPQEQESFVVKNCKTAGFFPQIIMTAVNGNEAARLVSEGEGISLFLKRTIVSERFAGLELIELDPPIRCVVSLCWRKDHPLSPGAKELIAFVRERTVPDVEGLDA